VPLLVRVLAGNSVTSFTILGCLNTADAGPLRQLHPAVAGVVASVPWVDTDTPVVDAGRWRAALPGAVGARLVVSEEVARLPALAALLAGVTCLDVRGSPQVTDGLLLRLPPSLRALTVRDCSSLTAAASFLHLPALASLDCQSTAVVSERTDGLPPSLRELDISGTKGWRAGASLAHLSQLQVLRASSSALDAGTLASLPPSLLELHAAHCASLAAPAASFAHLHELRTLDVRRCGMSDDTLANMPPSLVSLNIAWCLGLTSAAVLPPLPALRLLDVRGTQIGDALVGSLPASLEELQVVNCRGLTPGATLDHVPSLRMLHCSSTELSRDVLMSCRARGCAVPILSQLHEIWHDIAYLAVLRDGRLACNAGGSLLRLWDVADGGTPAGVAAVVGDVSALAGVPDGRRLAVGVVPRRAPSTGCVEVWNLGSATLQHDHTALTCSSRVTALGVLADGRLAAGCADGSLQVESEGEAAGDVAAWGHTRRVSALAGLPDGTLASGSHDATVRLWDVDARTCVATLAGHRSEVSSLAVLADGRLASGSYDKSVRLWDVAARTCVGTLTGHVGRVTALAALPDGRLATGADDGTIRLWDTRPAATAAASHAASAVPAVVWGRLMHPVHLLAALPEPDGDGDGDGDGRGRLVSTTEFDEVTVRLWDLPPPAPYE